MPQEKDQSIKRKNELSPSRLIPFQPSPTSKYILPIFGLANKVFDFFRKICDIFPLWPRVPMERLFFATNGKYADLYRYRPLPKRKTSAVTGPPMEFQIVNRTKPQARRRRVARPASPRSASAPGAGATVIPVAATLS